MGVRSWVLIGFGALLVSGTAAPAFADNDWRRYERQEWRDHAWREHERREHEWREHARHERQWREHDYAPAPAYNVGPGYYR